MANILCTNLESCTGEMEDRGNYYFCPECGSLEFKLPDRDGVFNPLPKQDLFLNSVAKFGLYVGGVGSGKTMVGCYKAIIKGMEHPDGMGLIGAQTYPQLRDATMDTFWMVCPEKLMWGGSKEKGFSKTESILTLSNGFKILFRPLDDESKLRSLNLVFFWIDESSEVPEEIFMQLQSRLRSLKGFINGVPAHQGWITTNPNGKDWQYKKFVLEHDPNYFWVNAPTRENIHLPPGFEEDLRRKWPKAWVDRFLEGSFDVFEGQIYPMLDANLHPHHNILELSDMIHRIPDGWPVFVTLDHGVTNPTAAGFYTIFKDPRGRERVIKFDEHYENNKPVSYHVRVIKEKLQSWGRRVEDVADWLIDPSTKGQRGMEGRAVMDEYRDLGLPFRSANNQVMAGILQVIEYLMPDENGVPFFYIDPRCIHTWEEMLGYKWKKRPISAVELNQPDEPIKFADHTCDETRYFLMTRPKISLLKASDSYLQTMLRQGSYQLNEKKLPFALRSQSNFNKGGMKWPNW